MRCPLCNGTFTAPALTAAAPPPPPLPVPALEIVSSAPLPLPPEQPWTAPREEGKRRDTGLKPGVPPEPPPPPLPPGDYTHSFKIRINPKILPWIAPGGLFLIVILTIFPWLPVGVDVDNLTLHVRSANAWSWGFGHSDAIIGLYLILLLLSLIVAIPSALVSLRLIPAPPFIQTLGPWRLVIGGGGVLLGFLFFLMRYLHVLFAPAAATVWFRFAFCIHFVVVIALLLEIWLEFRRLKNLPLPRLELYW
jgi:hypothetical protein